MQGPSHERKCLITCLSLLCSSVYRDVGGCVLVLSSFEKSFPITMSCEVFEF